MFNQLNYVAYSVRGIVAYQKVYMVFVGFHSYNTISFGVADIIFLLFYIVSNRTIKYLFAVLSGENYMHI